jgi:hypothetical protein
MKFSTKYNPFLQAGLLLLFCQESIMIRMKTFLYIFGILGVVKGALFLLAPQFMIDTAQRFMVIYPESFHPFVNYCLDNTVVLGLISLVVGGGLVLLARRKPCCQK